MANVYMYEGMRGTKNLHLKAEYRSLRMTFTTERGFGHTRHTAVFQEEDFADLARTMMHANPEAAMKAFGTAL